MKNKKSIIRFALVLTLYLLWSLWVGSWWALLLVPVIFDIYITKKVHWAFWKKKGVKKQTPVVEWIDAIIFATVAATFIRIFFFEAYTIPTSSMEKSMLVGDYLFVSKVAYGPKLPNTPLAVPFTHHTMPMTQGVKAYSESIQWPYKRLAGLCSPKRNDVMVFNFPAGDTVVMLHENPDYYSQIREGAMMYQQNQLMDGDSITYKDAENVVRKMMKQNYNIITRPVDKRENYIKRGVGMPGDTLTSVHGQLYVNGELADNPEKLQFNYKVTTNGTPINKYKLKEIGVSFDDMGLTSNSTYYLPLTLEMVESLEKLPNVQSIEKMERTGYDPSIFPFDARYPWNVDNFGPLYVPRKGDKVELNVGNLPLYERIIRTYEGNELEVKGEEIFINGKKATDYTFKMDYYWMMGDNRHQSADSRYWGFVPEDHLVGKAFFVWLSIDKDNKFLDKIRWNRLFTFVH